MTMFAEAHLLFACTVALSAYLLIRVLEAGLLGSLSVRYAQFFNRENKELKLLQQLQDAQRASVFFKSPAFSREERDKFEALVGQVPVDEATEEAILQGPVYKEWIKNMKLQLSKRASENLYAYRNNEVYFRDTFCKMSQGLAPMRVWKEAQETQEAYNTQFQEIADWASKLQPGWERQIFQERAREVDERMHRERAAMAAEYKRLQEEQERRHKEQEQERNKKRAEIERQLAKQMEEDLMREEEEEALAALAKHRKKNKL